MHKKSSPASRLESVQPSLATDLQCSTLGSIQPREIRYIGHPDVLVQGNIVVFRDDCQHSSSFFFSSSSSSRHSFNTEDLVSAPNLELGCAVILHNCASDYIQTVLVV